MLLGNSDLNLCFQPRDCLTTSTNGGVLRTKHCPRYITLPTYDPLGKLAQYKHLKLALIPDQTVLVYMLIASLGMTVVLANSTREVMTQFNNFEVSAALYTS